MSLNTIFDEDAKIYDEMRPRYTPALFKAIAERAGVGRALEIGAGTGQATESMLKMGYDVTAIEPGHNMAEFLRGKFPGLKVCETRFEDFPGGDGTFDLIYSATAFHWVSEDYSYDAALRLLKPGGVLAIFWNHPFPSEIENPMYAEMQSYYAIYRPGSKPSPPFTEKNLGKYRELMEKHGFVNVTAKLFHSARRFDADKYIRLLNTYSDHRAMETAARLALEAGVRGAILKYGNALEMHDTIDLYMGNRNR